MFTLDVVFEAIIRFCLVAFVLLGAGVVVMRRLHQPVERIRFIQITLLGLFASAIFSQASFMPTIDLAWLPADGASLAPESSGRVGLDFEEHGGGKHDVSTSQPHLAAVTDVESSGERNRENVPNRDRVSTLGADAAYENTAEQVPVSADWRLSTMVKRVVVYGFLFFSLFNAAYLVVGFVAARRLIAQSAALPDTIAAQVERIARVFSGRDDIRFVSSSEIVVPMVCGVFRPTILLPQQMSRADADPLQLKHSLAHEWKHIDRQDLLTWQLVSLCQVLLWVQPCYWILRRELRVCQDQIADRFATGESDEQAEYASTLLELSRAQQRILPGALSMTGPKSNLYRRVEMLLNEEFRLVEVSRKMVIVTFAVVMGLFGVLLTSLQLSHAAIATTFAALDDTENSGNKAQDALKKETPKVKVPAESAEHFGFVFDIETNKPIEGATVTVTRMNSGTWKELAVTKSITDASGKYTFTIPPEQLQQRLLYILFDLDHPEYARRHCGSYSYGMIVRNLKLGAAPWFEKLKMAPGAKISGRLVDQNDRPVAGAQLRAVSIPKTGSDRIRTTSVRGVSDKDGRFELVGTRSGIAKLSIIPIDHSMKHVELGDKRGDIGDIHLSSGVTIEGTVQDAKGNPMKGLWVNLTHEETRRDASYEMKRSSKTDAGGRFRTRPLQPGKYIISIDTKATGALEKLKYANFHDTPPPAMFVQQTIEVSEDSSQRPFIIRAVPHVLISLQNYNSKGDISRGHSPYINGRLDGRFVWIREGRKTGKGAYELMAPHGLENAELRFITNEHSGLTVQFEGKAPSTQTMFRFDRLEEDIENIRVVRYVAPLLQIKIVDESGSLLKDARIFATYATQPGADERMLMYNQIGFHRQEDGILRLSSLVSDVEFEVRATLDGFEAQTKKMVMKEGQNKKITLTLRRK